MELAMWITVVGFVVIVGIVSYLVYLSRPFQFDTAEERREFKTVIPGGDIPSSVEHKTSYYTSSHGRLFTQVYTPRTQAIKGIVYQIHGYGDTSQWFNRINAIRLANKGFKVVSCDLLTHGWSDGLHVYIPDFTPLIESAHEFFASVKQQPDNTNLSHFLFAESMGGAVAIRMCQMYDQSQWAGIILSAPMCKLSDNVKPPQVVITLLTKLSSWFPRLPIVPTSLSIDGIFKRAEVAALAKQNKIFYADRKPRIKTALSLLGITQHIDKTMEEIKAPLLVLHGAADLIADPECSRIFVTRAQSQDKTLKVYSGMWHSLLSGETEENLDIVWGDIIEWLVSRA